MVAASCSRPKCSDETTIIGCLVGFLTNNFNDTIDAHDSWVVIAVSNAQHAVTKVIHHRLIRIFSQIRPMTTWFWIQFLEHTILSSHTTVLPFESMVCQLIIVEQWFHVQEPTTITSTSQQISVTVWLVAKR